MYDENDLRRLLQMGMSPQDIASITPDGENALAQLLQGGQKMPQPNYDIAPMQQNTMRTESGPDAGKVVNLDFNAQKLYDQGRQAFEQAKQPAQMRVVGSGNGTIVDLSPEPVQDVQLDRTRAPIDIPGVGRAIYSKDGRGAYVLGPDGRPSTKVLLGYDLEGSMALNKAEQARRKGEVEIAHTQEQTRASQVNNPDTASVGGSGLTGDAYLQSLDPALAAEVKAYAEGRLAFPTGAALRNPRVMNLMQAVAQYDPNFDAKDYNARNRAMIGFTSGKQGDAIRAVNQAINHAGSLSGDIEKLDNFNGIATPLNSIWNPVEQFFGDPRQGNFKQNALALSSELRKVFAGSGGGSLSELQSWESGLPVNASKEQQKAYLAKGLDLLQGGINALNDQYTRAMGPRANVMDIISPKAKGVLAKLTGMGEGPSPETTGEAPQSSTFNSMPNPAKYPGRRVQADDGTIYKSDGSRWVRQ